MFAFITGTHLAQGQFLHRELLLLPLMMMMMMMMITT
jgi:hypothetical protein